MKKLNEIDVEFIRDVLIRCQAMLKMRMTDPNVCESNRERSREYAKMTQKAIDILTENSN